CNGTFGQFARPAVFIDFSGMHEKLDGVIKNFSPAESVGGEAYRRGRPPSRNILSLSFGRQASGSIEDFVLPATALRRRRNARPPPRVGRALAGVASEEN